MGKYPSIKWVTNREASEISIALSEDSSGCNAKDSGETSELDTDGATVPENRVRIQIKH